jgi:hypothetical protein
LSGDYSTIARLLRRWESGGALPMVRFDPRFKDLPQLWPEPKQLRSVLTQFGDAAMFAGLAKEARRYAKACDRDEHGRPSRYHAFDVLCFGLMGDAVFVGLRGAVEGATGRKVTMTRYDDRGEWGGDFFHLVEAVWPVACKIAEAVIKRLMPPNPSTPEARGKHLQRALKAIGRGG